MNAVGFADGPELEPAVFENAIVFVESRAAAVGEFPHGAADITAAIESRLLDITRVAEIGELVLGRRTGRTSDSQITVYRSVGVAAQDAAAAGVILGAAHARSVGTDVDL